MLLICCKGSRLILQPNISPSVWCCSPPGVGTADPAGNAKKQETEANTLTVAVEDSLPSDAVVHTIKAKILRKSGHVTFQLLRPVGFPSMCSFVVVVEWQTPELTEIGWQSVRGDEVMVIGKGIYFNIM